MGSDDVSFGRFRLDPRSRQLMRDGAAVPLGSRALDILCILAAANGEIVSKDELMARVWGGRIVEENNIQVHVSALRKALAGAKRDESHVVTVPHRGYRLIGLHAASQLSQSDALRVQPLPDGPSIAVLPFQSMSGEAEQEYFSDGIVEEITTALSRFSGLFVIARNSSFAYKGRAVDVKQVGRELGVRYVLEGSVRRAALRVRIIAQLIEAATGVHIWAERFDAELNDVFEAQDRLTASVVAAIAPKIEQAEIERAQRKPTENLEAYDHYLRGRAGFYLRTRRANDEALRSFQEAITHDDKFSRAYAMAAMCHTQRRTGGWTRNRTQEIAETSRLVDRAVQLGRDDADTFAWSGFALARVVDDFDSGVGLLDRALELNPNLAAARYYCGWVRIWLGEPDVALTHLFQAARLSPNDPFMAIQTAIAFAHFFAGRYGEGARWAQQALLEKPDWHPALRISAASNALAGRPDKAADALRRLRSIDPTLRVSNLKDVTTLRRADHFQRYADALRQAGLPE